MKLSCFYECAADNGCRYDSLTIYNTASLSDNHTGDFVGTYCGTNVPHSMTFMDGFTMIFKTDAEGAYHGFEIQYQAVQSKKTNLIFNLYSVLVKLIFQPQVVYLLIIVSWMAIPKYAIDQIKISGQPMNRGLPWQ